MKHDLDPTFAGDDVREDPDVVARPIDVEAERMLTLAFAREDVARIEHSLDVDSPRRKGPAREVRRVGPLEEVVELDAPVWGKLLKERVRVVPRHQLDHAE